MPGARGRLRNCYRENHGRDGRDSAERANPKRPAVDRQRLNLRGGALFGQGGQPADVQVEEVAGHPIDDEAYVALRDSAVSMVPEAEFAGKMSHDIAQQRRNEPSQDAAGQVAVDAAISVAGIETVGDEAYLVIRREGRMSGTLGGQDVSILLAGFTRLHQASGLIAEQVLETELRSQGTNPVRDRRHLICAIEPIG